ncbi:MAG TPA: hypothetical protein VKY89_23125 [Thermoanaerobaculia bacterium]|nr:hypothetical protein [Thermoanaerobaculia bacterium]
MLMVFPSTSTHLMAGSIGELTALIRLARGLSRERFRISYAELLRAWDPHPRVDGLLRRVRGFALLEKERGQSGLDVEVRPMDRAPDLIVLASFRAFFQVPIFPQLTPALLALWQAAGVRIAALDPCGDSFVCPLPPGVAVILPRPFTYGEAPRAEQLVFSAGAVAARPRRHHRWLWAAAPWMHAFPEFPAAERLAMLGLSRLGVEVSVLSPLDPSLPFLPQARVIREDLPYGELEAEVARHDLLITANCRSVLAARAAAMGVPLALVDPAALPRPGGHDPVTENLLRVAAGPALPPDPVPLEFRRLRCGDPEATAAAFVAVHHDLEELRERQRSRCLDYRQLPGAAACIEGLLA